MKNNTLQIMAAAIAAAALASPAQAKTFQECNSEYGECLSEANESSEAVRLACYFLNPGATYQQCEQQAEARYSSAAAVCEMLLDDCC